MVGAAARTITISHRTVGIGHRCFVIAEAGVNHNGSLDLAIQLADAAADAGADAVKFQTFRAALVATPSAPKARYQESAGPWGESQLEMLRRLELSEAAHRALVTHCSERGLVFLSTPFDEESVDLLAALGVPAFKIPSGELTNIPFLRHAARKGRPLIVSTGMATLAEVGTAVAAVGEAGCHDLVILHCVSNYPARAADVNLRAMASMASAFGVPVGYSDHTIGNEVALGAVALGACVIEKHMTLDRSLPGPDHRASAEPGEFAALVAGIRVVEAALGDGEKRPADAERETARAARRSLVAAVHLAPGTVLRAEMVTCRRPGTGMAPDRLGELLGRTLRMETAPGALLAPEMFE